MNDNLEHPPIACTPSAEVIERAQLTKFMGQVGQLTAKEMDKSLQPNRIYFVSALPKTGNAKLMRRVIRAAYLGEEAGDLSALENPNAVQEIESTR